MNKIKIEKRTFKTKLDTYNNNSVSVCRITIIKVQELHLVIARFHKTFANISPDLSTYVFRCAVKIYEYHENLYEYLMITQSAALMFYLHICIYHDVHLFMVIWSTWMMMHAIVLMFVDEDENTQIWMMKMRMKLHIDLVHTESTLLLYTVSHEKIIM